MKLSEIAAHINAELIGDGATEIHSIAALEQAGPGQLSFLSNAKYLQEFESTRAAAVIVPKGVESDRLTLLRSKDSYYAFAQAMVLLHGHRRHPHVGIHPRANVDPTATIGENTVIYPGVFVGPRARIGRDCILYPNAVIYDECVLGDRVIIHAGTVIGVDGFGYATHAGVHHKIPQAGNVTIGDDVEIGANCTIARGALVNTVIGAGTKIDGLGMIGHGATIGPGCMIVAQVGIAGSTTVGKYVTMGGQVAITGHLTIGDGATLAGRSAVMTDIEPKATVMGMPAMPVSHARRVYVAFSRLPELVDRVKRLERNAEPPSDGDDKD
ncbi:MAG: lpxD [Phycisphaerales bacterium]|nr:lpxD [Phycisphaerales bacterium]